MIFIESTKDTPRVHISSEEGIFEISGNSFSVSIKDFFKPVFLWVENDLPNIENDLYCTFKLDMINSETLKIFTGLFFKFSHYHEEGKNIHIKWIYSDDDEDIYETGLLLSELSKMTFTFEINEDFQT